MSKTKAKTINGSPTPVAALNVDAPAVLANTERGPLARIARIYRRLNDVMSGMYTGVGCAGTPHSHHSYDEQDKKQKPTD